MEVQEAISRFFFGVVNVLLWSTVCLAIIFVIVEILDWKYGAVKHIFGPEDATDTAIFLGALVLGVFYMVTQFVIH